MVGRGGENRKEFNCTLVALLRTISDKACAVISNFKQGWGVRVCKEGGVKERTSWRGNAISNKLEAIS